MPDISSLPAMPAAPVAPLGAVPPVSAEGDPGGLGFLAQLKTAMANLTTVAMPHIAPAPVASTPVTEQPLPLEDAPVPADDRDVSDVMPELLAALGFLPVPATLPTPVQPEPQPTAGEVRTTTSAVVPSAILDRALAPSAPVDDSVPAAPQQDTKPAESVTRELTPAEEAPAHVKAAAEHLATLHSDVTAAAAPQSEPEHEDTAQAAQPHAATVVPVAQHAATTPQFSGHGATADDRQDHDDADTPSFVDSVATPSSPPPEPRIEAVAAGLTVSTPIATTALPPHVLPSEVVNQISHQADLYRLPGNKGVRIQLHPEDLGGVDVTLRYSAAGGIQLHISVEHASTGALVQAGWNDLRDALATQGITPDRLVMSISAPNDASAMDFSSNNGNSGSYRSDAGQMSFEQHGQRQGEDAEPQRVSRAWLADTPTQADDSPRGTNSSARIDYRV